MIPPVDDYPERLNRAIHALLSSGIEAARDELAPIAYPPRVVTPRSALTISQKAMVFKRDGWMCRYCGGEVILTQVMTLLGILFPDVFPYHPNWKTGLTHPAIVSRSASVDHVRPGTLDASWQDVNNLVTACWLCNVRKADLTLEQLGWHLRPVPEPSQWEGLTELYPDLWEAAGRPPGDHRVWIARLRSSEAPR